MPRGKEINGKRKGQYHYPVISKTKNIWRYIFYYQKEKGVGDLFYTDIVTDKGFQYAESTAWGRATFDGCNFMKYVTKRQATANQVAEHNRRNK